MLVCLLLFMVIITSLVLMLRCLFVLCISWYYLMCVFVLLMFCLLCLFVVGLVCTCCLDFVVLIICGLFSCLGFVCETLWVWVFKFSFCYWFSLCVWFMFDFLCMQLLVVIYLRFVVVCFGYYCRVRSRIWLFV